MKKIKVRSFSNFFNIIYKNKSGMALLEFILLSVFVFIFLAAVIEFGSILKSEAILVEAVTKTTRTVSTSGQLSYDFANQVEQDLNKFGVQNVEIKIFDPVDSAEPVVQYSTASTDSSWNLDKPDAMHFRDNFKLIIKGKCALKGSSFAGFPEIEIPLIYGADGKIEMFTP